MAGSGKKRLPAKCPHCGARLRALAVEAGMRFTCPKCQGELLVGPDDRAAAVTSPPTTPAPPQRPASEDDAPLELEDADATAGLELPDVHIRVVCRGCGTRMVAARSQVGTSMVCPDCGVATVVQPPATPVRPGGRTRPLEDDEPLEVEDPKTTAGLDLPDVHIAVVCPLCGTRMVAARSQVGAPIACPDCGTKTVVRPPPAPVRPTSRTPPPEDDEPLELEDPDVSANLDLPDVHIAVICPLCGTRMVAARSQVGAPIVCPDCGTATVVPPAAPRKPKIVPLEDDAPLEVCPPVERPPTQVFGYDPTLDTVTPDDESPPDAGVSTGAWPGPGRSVPPLRVTFFSGVFGFPFRSEVWQHLLALSVALMVDLYLFFEAVQLGGGAVNKFSMLGIIFFTLASVLALGWSAVTAVSCLAIMQATAEASDQVDWPDALWLDWILDGLYIANSLALSILAGWGIARLLEWFGWSSALSVPLAVSVLFPMLFLSMLEAGSPFVPVSMSVLRCLVTGWRAWLVVYLETTALVTVVGGVTGAGVVLGGWLAAIGLVPLVVAALMVYFRLWGRLAWYWTRQSAALAAALEEEETDTEQEQPEDA